MIPIFVNLMLMVTLEKRLVFLYILKSNDGELLEFLNCFDSKPFFCFR